MADLLQGAEIPVDRGNAGRFKDRIDKALNTLADPEKMNGAPILKSRKYKQKIQTHGRRGWIDEWLNLGVILIPAQPYQDQQSKLRLLGASSSRPRKKGA